MRPISAAARFTSPAPFCHPGRCRRASHSNPPGGSPATSGGKVGCRGRRAWVYVRAASSRREMWTPSMHRAAARPAARMPGRRLATRRGRESRNPDKTLCTRKRWRLTARVPGWGLTTRQGRELRIPDKTLCTRRRWVLAMRLPEWGVTTDGRTELQDPARTLYNGQRRGWTVRGARDGR